MIMMRLPTKICDLSHPPAHSTRQELLIVGNCPELGAWSVYDTTAKLCWGEGHEWHTPEPVTLESPPDPIQFKVPSTQCAPVWFPASRIVRWPTVAKLH